MNSGRRLFLGVRAADMVRRIGALLWAVLWGALLVLPEMAQGQSIPAFSGADGAAAFVTGGRGGLVYRVTRLDRNFNDAEPGTLRYGLSDANFGGQPRTIVFDVAGVFWLGRFGAEMGHDNGWDTASRYNLGSNVTIAGQTAPGPVYIMGGLVKANGNNTILRNVSIAPGYGMRNFSQPEAGKLPTPGDFPDSYVYDAIDITGTNLMIDHVSTYYATDETISANELANNVTIQYSNISQGQNYPQADAEASGVTYTGHALGSLLQGGSNSKFSVHHNLYAHQKGRLPRVGSEVGTGAYNDFRNNVFYNWFGTGGGGASGQPSFNNFVANFWLAGPGGEDPVGGSSTAINPARAGGTAIFNGSNSSGTRVYHTGNLKDTNKDGDAGDGVALVNSDFGSSSFQANPLWSGGTATYHGVTDTASGAYNRVLDYMGSRWWDRDAVDARIVHEVRTGTGKIKAWADDPFNPDPAEGVEWRNLLALRADPVTGAAPFNRDADWDVDGDGMPGFWELAHNLDPNVADHNGDFDGDGYTNLEEYINEIAAWPAPAAIAFVGGTNNRYAQITNWDVNFSQSQTHHWQPSRFDTVFISSGTAVVDAVGQHAGTLSIAGKSVDTATLKVTGGWLEVASQLWVAGGGVGTVDHSGGMVAAPLVVVGGGGASVGVYNLSGGVLRAATLSKTTLGGSGEFNFSGGVLNVDVVAFDLENHGGMIAPGAPLGTTHVMGHLTLVGGSIVLELAGVDAGEYDRVVVDGTLGAGGVLAIGLVDGFAPAAGDRFDLLDFASASGSFALELPALAPGLAWDASELLTTGALAVTDGDFDGDLDVDGADFLAWQRGTADATGYVLWQQQFGNEGAEAATNVVPEPGTWGLAAAAVLLGAGRRRRARWGLGALCS